MFHLLLKLWLQFLIVPLSITLAELKSEGYRFKLDIGNPNVYCPEKGYQCLNGELHYLCDRRREPHPRCSNFKPIEMNQKTIKTFVEGTNGIRNKVATDLGLANMNLVYWSEELANMASRYARECLVQYDTCLIIGEKFIRVSQNIVFYKGQITDRWPGRMVRHWYMELGHHVKTWRDYKQRHAFGSLANISNLIYPLVEHIGCGGARMFNGYFIVCYYYPQHIRKTFPTNFTHGRPCTNCSKERKTCSKTFVGLCGVDLEISSVALPRLNIGLFFILVFILYACAK